MTQTADTKPGFYYVSVMRDDGQYRPLLGPFENNHSKALSLVEVGRRLAQKLDHRATWYSFGTIRTDQSIGEGILNKEAML